MVPFEFNPSSNHQSSIPGILPVLFRRNIPVLFRRNVPVLVRERKRGLFVLLKNNLGHDLYVHE